MGWYDMGGKAGKRWGSCSTANEKVYMERDAGNWDSRRLNGLMNERKLVI